MFQCIGILRNIAGYSVQIQYLVACPDDAIPRLRMISEYVMPGRVKYLMVESILPHKESVK